MINEKYVVWAWSGITSIQEIKQGILAISDSKIELFFDPVSPAATYTLLPADTTISVTADYLIVHSSQFADTKGILRISTTNSVGSPNDPRFQERLGLSEPPKESQTGSVLNLGAANISQMMAGANTASVIIENLKKAGFSTKVKATAGKTLTTVFLFLGIACVASVLLLLAGVFLHLPGIFVVLGVVALLIVSTLTLVNKLYS